MHFPKVEHLCEISLEVEEHLKKKPIAAIWPTSGRTGSGVDCLLFALSPVSMVSGNYYGDAQFVPESALQFARMRCACDLPGYPSCFQSIRYADILRPDVILPFTCANYAWHYWARMHADPHVNVEIVARRPHLTDVTNHAKAEVDTAACMIWIRLRHTRHAIITVAQKFYPQHIILLQRQPNHSNNDNINKARIPIQWQQLDLSKKSCKCSALCPSFYSYPTRK